MPDDEISTGLALVESTADRLHQAMDDCAQGRTPYTIRRFVVGPHAPSEAWMYRQCVIEMATLEDNIRRGLIQRERIALDLDDIDDRIRAAAVSERTRRRAELDREEKLLEHDGNERSLLNYTRQFRTFAEIWASLPKFTREELEAADPEYWEQHRLPRQAALDLAAAGTGISVGQLDALRQVGLLDDRERYQRVIGEALTALGVDFAVDGPPQLEDVKHGDR